MTSTAPDNSVNDTNLLVQIGVGGAATRAAIAALHDRYAKRFIAHLVVHGFSLDDAEDIVQNVFVNLLHRRTPVSAIASVSPYLWRCLKNAAADYRRQQMHDKNRQISTSQAADNYQNPDPDQIIDPMLQNEPVDGFEECFERAFEAFRNDFRDRAEILSLVAIEGWTLREAAEFLDRTYAASREFVSQCRKRFREYLLRYCSDYFDDPISDSV